MIGGCYHQQQLTVWFLFFDFGFHSRSGLFSLGQTRRKPTVWTENRSYVGVVMSNRVRDNDWWMLPPTTIDSVVSFF